jgi:hypothetical protein
MNWLDDYIINVIETERLYGIYLAKPTGKVFDDDKTYIEITLAGKNTYAKPCLPMGYFYVPNEKWLEKYKDEIMVWVMFENGDPASPTYMGVCPLDGKMPSTEGYPSIMQFKSEQYLFTFNDEKKYIELKGDNFSLMIDTDKEIITLENGGGSIVMDKNKGLILTAKNNKTIHIDLTGKIHLGTENGAAHSGTYADILVQVLQAMMSMQSNIISITTAFASTQGAASVGPLAGYAAGFATFGSAMGAINTQISNINTMIPQIESNSVTLD